MRKLYLISTLVLALMIAGALKAQDFSNKGKDFYIAYTGHIDGTNSVMGLYLTSDVSTSGTVKVGSTTLPFNVSANKVTTIFIGRNGAASNLQVYNGQSDGINSGAGIHVTSLKNVIVYSHIINSARSGATLILPTPVLGKEYVVPSYQNYGSQAGSPFGYGQITVVAVQPNTTIEIVPKANDRSRLHPAGVAFQVTLPNAGDVYQLQSEQNGDFSGSTVRSVQNNPAQGCQPISVFSSTTWSAFDCGSQSSGGDNLYQQLFPTKSWGKKFVTAPFINKPYDIIRVFVTDATTVVRKTESGFTTTLGGLQAGSFYEYKTNQPTVIEADKPVSVAQYITSQTCGGGNSDPEMTLINPVEQTLTDITLFSAHANYVPSGQTQVTDHYLNIVIPTIHKNSLRIDYQPPLGTIIDIPGSGYSYVQENVTRSSAANPVHNITADTGFTAIVYGYGNVESYGYNAGTNLRDLYQYISVNNNYASVDFPAACKNAPFELSMTFPYQPTEIKWVFGTALNAIGFSDLTLSSPAFTSSAVVNGRTLYKYTLPGSFTLANAGSYPIKIVAQNPTADGCNGVQEIDYELQVYDLPTVDFAFTTNGCVSSPVSFVDKPGNTGGRPLTHWHWNFGDGNTVNDVTSTSHTFSRSGNFDVKYTAITDIGCKADTVMHTVTLNDPPEAKFSADVPYCAGKTIAFKDLSSVSAASVINKWVWNFGDGSPVVTITSAANASPVHTYTSSGSYTVTLRVETSGGCASTVFSSNIIVSPVPVVNFNLPDVCQPAGTALFNSLSTISDGSESQFAYAWDFGDAATGSGQTVSHNYSGNGPYTVGLTVTSNNGCASTSTKILNTIYPEPQAAFTAPAEVCLGGDLSFTDKSVAGNSTVTQWRWDFGDATTASVQNPVKRYTTAGVYTVTLSVTSAIGCQSVTKIASQQVTVLALPVAGFNISLPGCVNQTINFSDASLPNSGTITKWKWDYGDGQNIIKNDALPVSHMYATASTFNASLQVETDKGCVSPLLQKQVIIYNVPVAEFTVPEICVNDIAAPFTDASRVQGGTISTWEWNFGDGNATGANPNTAAAQNPTHHFTVPGNYTAQLIATSNNGCKDTAEHTVTVNGAILTPSFTITNAGSVCSNKELSIKDASQVNAGKILRLEIFWDANDLSVKTTDNNYLPGKIYTHSYASFGTPASKVYKVRLDVYSGITCVSSYTQDITILAVPILDFASIMPVCSNAPSFQLSQNLLQNGLNGTGLFTGSGVSAAGLFDPAKAGEGQHELTYTFTATNGCSNSATRTVLVNPTPIADAGPDKVVLEGGFVTLSPKMITNIPVTYEWTPVTWLNNPGIANPQVSPQTDFSYLLTVTSDKGCTTSDEVFVKLLKAPVIPNIFSPNGDGIHDRWVIDYLESYPGCIVQIFNRYGQAVYKIVNYTTPWDGKINGKDAPVGTYYYIIDPKNGRKPITGYVDIIR